MSIATRKIVLSAAGAGGVVGGGFLTEFGVLNSSSTFVEVHDKPKEALSVFGASWSDHVYIAGRTYPYTGGSSAYGSMWAAMVDASDGSMPDSFSDFNTQNAGQPWFMQINEMPIYRDTSTSDNAAIWAGNMATYAQGYLVNYIYSNTYVYSTGRQWKTSTDFTYCAKFENPTATNQRALFTGGTRLVGGSDYRATVDRTNTSHSITNSATVSYSSGRNDNTYALVVKASNNYVVCNNRFDQNTFSGHTAFSSSLGFAGAYQLSISSTYGNNNVLNWPGFAKSICSENTGNQYTYSAGVFTGNSTINNSQQIGYLSCISGTSSLSMQWNKGYYKYDTAISFNSVDFASDGDLLVGGTYGTDSGLIMKIDKDDGSIIYAKTIKSATSNTSVNAVVMHSDGRLIVQGRLFLNNDQYVAFISEDTLGNFGDYEFIDVSGNITTATVATMSTVSVTADTPSISTTAPNSAGAGVDLDTSVLTLS
jgi:hypothetical protein